MPTVTRFATTNSQVSGTWTNPTNIYASDSAVASVTVAAKNTTNTLRIGGFGFDGQIPAGSTINSVSYVVRQRVTTTAGIANLNTTLVITATAGTINSVTAEPTTLTTYTYNTQARPGGGSWTRADLLDGTFFAEARAVSGNDATSVTYEWDYISVTVDYTAADTTAPTVSTFSPTNGATNVNPTSNIVLTFDETIARGTGTITLRSGSAAGTIIESYDAATSNRLTLSGAVLTVDPTNNLADSTTYFLVIPSGAITDAAATPNSYAGTSTYSFTTGDYTAPTVSTFSPLSGATGVAVNSNVVLTFNEAIQRGTGTITLRSGSAAGTIIESFDAAASARISVSGSTWTLDPTNDLAESTNYYVVIPSGAIKDTSTNANSYAGTSTYNFTTGDFTAPTVSTFSPLNGATNVNPTSNIVLTFDETIARGTGTITLRSGSAAGTIIESFDAATSNRLTLSGSTLTVDPTSNLADSATYFLVIPSGALTDSAANAYQGTSTYSFTTGDYTAPTVSTFSPASGATLVAVNSNVVLTFSEAVQRGTGTVTLRSGSASGTIIESYNAATSDRISISGSTWTLDPTSALAESTTYYVVIPSGAITDTSVNANAYAGTSTYNFTTGDFTAPTVSTFSPTNGATNVAVASNIVLTFSETIARGTGTITLRSGSAAGTIIESYDAATSNRLSISGSTFTVDPTSNLAETTTYYLVIPSGAITDAAGNGYGGTSTYSFTTGDFTAPTVVTFNPASGSTNIAVNANIVLGFSEAVQRGTGTITLRSGSAAGTIIESFNAASSNRISISGSTWTLDPTNDLAELTTYFLVIPSGAITDTSINANPYAGTSSYSFTTGDFTAPTISTFSPLSGATNVTLTTNLVLTFNESIARGTGTITLRSGSAAGTIIESFDAAASGRISVSGSTWTLDPTSNLSDSTTYFLVIPSGAITDTSANANPYGGTSTYSFTTGDYTAPTVSTFSPLNGATDVSRYTSITLTFSEAVQLGTGTITLRVGSAAGSITESFNAATSPRISVSGSSWTLTPTALAEGTTYYLVIPSGAVTDTSANANVYAGTSSYSFTTRTALEFPPTPTNGDVMTYNGRKWTYDGNSWDTVTIASAADLTGNTLAENVLASSLTSVGTIGTGVWQGTAIGNTYIATGLDVGKLTVGTTLPSNVATSSLTSVGTLSSLTVTNNITSSSGIISAGAELRLGNNTFSRVADVDGAGAFGGGYNFYIDVSTPKHDSTGAIAGYYYTSGGTVQFYTGASAAAGTIATERMRLDANGRLGLGTGAAALTELLTVKSATQYYDDFTSSAYVSNIVLQAPANDYPQLRVDAWGGAATGNVNGKWQAGEVLIRRVRGTLEVPLPTQSGDILGSFIARGYNSNTGYSGGMIRFLQTGAQTASGNPTAITFYTNSGSGQTGGETMRLDASGRLGLGATSLTQALTVKTPYGFYEDGSGSAYASDIVLQAAASEYPAFQIEAWGGAATATENAYPSFGEVRLFRNRGTLESPLATQSGDILGAFTARGYNSNISRFRGGSIQFVQTGAQTATTIPTAITFWTSYGEAMRLDANGNLGIGTTSQSAKLEVNGSGKFTGGVQATGSFLSATNSYSGSVVYRTVSTASPSVSQTGGLDGLLYTAATAAYRLRGGVGYLETTSSVTDSMYGLSGYAVIYGSDSPTVPHAIGLVGQCAISDTAVVTRGVAIEAQWATPSGSPTVTNAYGVYVNDIPVGTNRWAIKTGTGKVEFGDQLIVAGNGTFGGNLAVDTNTLFVDAANNRVGVGTASPTAPFHLLTPAGTAPKVYIAQTATSAWSVGSPASTNALTFIDEQFSATRMTLDASGNLGVGVTPNNNKFVVKGVHTTGRSIAAIQTSDSATGAPAVLGFYNASDSRIGFIGAGAATEFVIEASENVPMMLYTNGVERWRITAAGHFIGGADNSYDIGASGATRPRTGYFGTSVVVGTDPGGSNLVRAASARITSLGVGLNASGTAGRIDASNDVVAYSTSDPRLKENITPIRSALDLITHIDGVTYTWKQDELSKQHHGYGPEPDLGVLADQVAEVLPQVVQVRESGYKAVRYERLIPVMIEAIKQLREEVRSLREGR